MKKKYIMILLAAALTLSACGAKETTEQPAEQQETTQAGDGEASEEEEAATFTYDPVLYEDLTSKVVSLGDYKGLEATRVVEEVTDEDVQKEVDGVRKSYSEVVDVERPAELGDIVLIDYTGYVDGETSDSLQGKEYSLELGSGTFIPGFEDQLVGASAGEDVEVNVTFPEEYNPQMAGKDARFEVHVQNVQEYQLDEWGDDFIRENLDYDSEEAMKTTIREELEQTASEEADANVEYDLIQKFLDNCEFEIQDADVEAYIDDMMSEYETYATAYQMELEDFLQQAMGITEAQLREMFRETANFRVKMTISFHEVAEAEGLAVTQEEYMERGESLAEEYGYDSVVDVEEVYSRAMIEEQMIQEKVIELIRENAVIS